MIKTAIRTSSFFGRWFSEIVRQPTLILSLILGPFLILLAFGVGIVESPPTPRVVAVTAGSSAETQELLALLKENVPGTREMTDLQAARQQLADGKADAVVVLPPDPAASVQTGQYAPVYVYTDVIDPNRSASIYAYLTDLMGKLNKATVTNTITQAKDSAEQMAPLLDQPQQAAGAAGAVGGQSQVSSDLNQLRQFVQVTRNTPPEVLAAPYDLKLENLAPLKLTQLAYYSPAVLALLLQHLAITLGALSMTRVRLLGIMELLRASPVRPLEVLSGTFASYFVLCVIVAAALTTLIVGGLGVPLFGSYTRFVELTLALIGASLALGFAIAMVSTSEQAAVQAVMLVLLSSIFFSGLIFSLERVAWPIKAISYGLPTTYAVRSYQDVMLRGNLRSPDDLIVLGAVAGALFILALLLLRRQFRPA